MNTLSAQQIEKLHRAAELIEIYGDRGIMSTIAEVGEEVVVALLIAHLRRGYGSMETYPPPEGLESKVNMVLKWKKLME